MDDHHRDPLRFPTCARGCVWKQRGNVTGHCAKCHETFEGISLFDRHQVCNEDGSVTCQDPAGLKIKGVPVTLREGSWRGPGMDQDAISARRKAEEAS